jgi:hypothetical protein
MLFEKDPNGALAVTIAQGILPNKKALQWDIGHDLAIEHPGMRPAPRLRPVLFDAQKKRYLLTGAPAGSGSVSSWRGGPGVTLSNYRSDPGVLQADKVRYFGI